jgi:uncharacterized membrane protein YjjB (DUF3815 family)
MHDPALSTWSAAPLAIRAFNASESAHHRAEANSLRLVLVDMGMMLAPAAFLAAVVIGLVALLVERRFNVPRMATVVAPIVIMMPGIYAYEMIVLFNRGPVLDALQASAVCGFVIGALAMGPGNGPLFQLEMIFAVPFRR